MTQQETALPLDSLNGRVANFGGLVAYHEGSPVSKSLITTKNGTVTVYALEKGQSLSEHTARSHAAVLILEGEAEVTNAGKTYNLQKGDGTVFPAGRPHAVTAVKQCKMLLSLVRS